MYPRIYKEFAPGKHLRQFIKCYWTFEKTYKAGEFEHVFPDSSYELIYSNATYTANGLLVPRLFVVGQLLKPVDFFAIGLVRLWCVRFYPWGLMPFGDVNALSSHDWKSADQVFRRSVITDLTKKFKKITDKNFVNMLDEYFLKLLLQSQFSKSFLKKATQKLLVEKGNIKVRDLVDYCYISKRQLEREIKGITGHTPREITARLRFEQARDAIMYNPDIPISFLAQENGYTDQSHLINDFKKYTAMTPNEYAEMFRRLKPQMQNRDNVAFLQDNDSSKD